MPVTAEIRIDVSMVEGMVEAMAKRFGRLLREHAALPDTPPEVADWVARVTAVIEEEFKK